MSEFMANLLSLITAVCVLVAGPSLGQCQMKETPRNEEDEGVLPKGHDGKTLNLDFETGTLWDWTVEGDAFSTLPIRGDEVKDRLGLLQSGFQGRYWVGSFHGRGDESHGTLTSVPFKVSHPWATFLVGGGNRADTGVEIVRRDTNAVIHREPGTDVEDMQRVAVDLTAHLGKEIVVRVVDRNSGPWGHINFDDFRFHAKKPSIKPLMTQFEDRYAEGKRAFQAGEYSKAKVLLRETVVARERKYLSSQRPQDAALLAEVLYDWAELCLFFDPAAGLPAAFEAVRMRQDSNASASAEEAEARLLLAKHFLVNDSQDEALRQGVHCQRIYEQLRKDSFPVREAFSSFPHLMSYFPISIRFVNRLQEPVEIMWLNGSSRKTYKVLQPNKAHDIQTYVGNRWIVVGADNQVVGTYRANLYPTVHVVAASPAPANAKELVLPAPTQLHAGIMAANEGRMAEAESHFRAYAKVRPLPGDDRLQRLEFARWHTEMARIERVRKRPQEAMKHAKQAESIWKLASRHEPFIESYKTELEIGLAEWMLGNRNAAENRFANAKAIRRRIHPDNRIGEPRTHQELALAFHQIAENGAADSHARLATMESIAFLNARSDRTSAANQIRCFRSILECIVPHVAYDIKANRTPAEIYETVIQWKGINTVRECASRRAWFALYATDPETAELVRKLRDVTCRLAASQTAIPDMAASDKHSAETYRLYDEWDQLQYPLRGKTLEYERKHPSPAITVADIQSQLPPKTALLEYVGYSEPADGRARNWKIAAFVVTQKDVHLVELSFATELRSAIDEFETQIRRGSIKTDEQSAAMRLRNALWAPVEPHLRGIKNVLLAPDLDVCKVTFAALPSADGKRHLVEDYAFTHVNLMREVGRQLKEPAWKPGSGTKMLAFGDVDFGQPKADAGDTPKSIRRLGRLGFDGLWSSLPGTRREVEAIEKLFKQALPQASFRFLRGKEASADHFREYAPQSEILHLATHGYTVQNANLQPNVCTGIVFAGINENGREDESVITALEMMNFDLSKVRLAVLSACESGTGLLTAQGEGILGPHRTLQMAGVQSIIASRWKVDDEATRLLMERFYENLLAKKLGVGESLREAQVWLMREGKSAMTESTLRGIARLYPRDPEAAPDNRLPPSLWAPFVLHGDWR
jgi:CHAT domain-containing protein